MAALMSFSRWRVVEKATVTRYIESSDREKAVQQVFLCLLGKPTTVCQIRSYFAQKLHLSRSPNTQSKTRNQHPKTIISNFYREMSDHLSDKTVIPELKAENDIDEAIGNNIWAPELDMEVFTEALERMKQLKLLTAAKKPKIHDPNFIQKFLDLQQAPFVIKLDDSMKTRIQNLLNKYSEIEEPLNALTGRKTNGLVKTTMDAITGCTYHELGELEAARRNEEMLKQRRMLLSTENKTLLSIMKMQQSLPIFAFRNLILKTIEDNPVVVLSGETGCGKTTQIPQYIFNSLVERLEGSRCNTIVTQPRRISAINISQRVAEERGEELGETVGYHVRLSSHLPQQKGAILFCTIGILLRRLQSNPSLEGISHVIIDEAHERNIITDFLLVLLRDIVMERRNPKLRIIIMSASMNVKKLVDYFDGCPLINVPGRIYPIKDYYLPEIENMMKNVEFSVKNTECDQSKRYELDFVAKVIEIVDLNRPPGAILCFLTGWQEIQDVYSRILEIFPNRSTHVVFPVHSRIPQQDQARIFERLPIGTRKIVLATNIAETSITIDDVVYVVDSGQIKETYVDAEWGVTSLRTRWATQANVAQRRGRAGRVQAGECFHLYPRNLVEEMEPFPVPEIQRVSLEKVILDAKLYCSSKDKSAVDFLSRCPDPPSLDTMQKAIQDLQERRILTNSEELTPLGRCVSLFSSHPYISKAIVYASWLRCLHPSLTVAAYLTGAKEPYLNESIIAIRELKEKYARNTNSDHLAFKNLFEAWEEIFDDECYQQKQFCEQNEILHSVMEFAKGLRTIFASHLVEAGLAKNFQEALCSRSTLNEFGDHSPHILASLCAGFEPNFVRILLGRVKNGRIVKNAFACTEVNGGRVTLEGGSVNCQKKRPVSSPWLTYFNKTCLGDSGMAVVRQSSAAPPMAVLLFTGQNVQIREVHEKDSWCDHINIDDPLVLSVNGQSLLGFCCSRSDANLLLKLRNIVDEFIKVHLSRQEACTLVDPAVLEKVEAELLKILMNLFELK